MVSASADLGPRRGRSSASPSCVSSCVLRRSMFGATVSEEDRPFGHFQRSTCMKIILRFPYALSGCAAAAILAGCGGAAQSPNPTTQTPLGNTDILDRPASPSIFGSDRLNSGRGKVERLRARRIHPSGGGEFPGPVFVFLARGSAEGPYPGTFTAHCILAINTSSVSWGFSEGFIIRSGASKINGTIIASGPGLDMPIPGVYQYATTNGYSGNVRIQQLGRYGGSDGKDFREVFDGI